MVTSVEYTPTGIGKTKQSDESIQVPLRQFWVGFGHADKWYYMTVPGDLFCVLGITHKLTRHGQCESPENYVFFLYGYEHTWHCNSAKDGRQFG